MPGAVVDPDAHDFATEDRRDDQVRVVIVVDVERRDLQRACGGLERNRLRGPLEETHFDGVGDSAAVGPVRDRDIRRAVGVEVGDRRRRTERCGSRAFPEKSCDRHRVGGCLGERVMGRARTEQQQRGAKDEPERGIHGVSLGAALYKIRLSL